MARREYTGGASATTLSAGITAGALSLTIADATGWPTGAVGKFGFVIDRGLASEEKVYGTTRTGTTITITSGDRGADGTAAASHSAGAAVEHVLFAADLDEANAHVNDTSSFHTAAGITNVPAGNIAATNVQSAINELDTEKQTAAQVASAIATATEASGLIAITQYNPGSASSASTASATFATISSTNLSVTFTVPTTGKVLGRLVGAVGQTAAAQGSWRVIDGSAAEVTNSRAIVAYDKIGAERVTHDFYVTGLTGGSSQTWTWQHATGSGTTTLWVGSVYGPAVMEVWRAP